MRRIPKSGIHSSIDGRSASAKCRRRVRFLFGLTVAGLAMGGCDTTGGIVGGVVGATVYGASSPAHEVEQIYYLGSFDPQGQLPPAMYRVRVHGQASAISGVRFASGWVPAGFVDSLGSHAGFTFPKKDDDPSTDDPRVQLREVKAELKAQLTPGRRLMQFGPEGFREAPKDHRLVIVMGGSPDAFFEAIDGALGDFSTLRAKGDENAAKALMLQAQLVLNGHREALDALEKSVANAAATAAALEPEKEPEKKPEEAAQTDTTNQEKTVVETQKVEEKTKTTTKPATGSGGGT